MAEPSPISLATPSMPFWVVLSSKLPLVTSLTFARIFYTLTGEVKMMGGGLCPLSSWLPLLVLGGALVSFCVSCCRGYLPRSQWIKEVRGGHYWVWHRGRGLHSLQGRYMFLRGTDPLPIRRICSLSSSLFSELSSVRVREPRR